MTDPEPATEGKAGEMEVDGWTDFLGGLVERHPRFWIRLGNWETRLVGDRIGETAVDRPLYVSGLARSGSTILLELLDRHSHTASHRYRDFPLVLTPWAWNRFVDRAARHEQTARERAHRDRIQITAASPEAFEEVIWMAFFRDLHDPATSAVLDETTSNPDFETFYRDHVRKLLALRGARRYLAKGNYNVTRLRYLKRIFPDARFVVPIRDPVWHVASLMKQHRLLAEAAARNLRVTRYMRRSGHFEFGPDRRPVNAGDDRAVREVLDLWRDGKEAAGWAALWASVYGHVADVLETPGMAGAALVVRYEELCRDPGSVFPAVLAHCGLDDEGLTAVARTTLSLPDYYRPAFDDEELEAIRERTAPVARRFGYADEATPPSRVSAVPG